MTTDKITAILEKITLIVWGPATVVLFLAVGAYFTVRLGVLQLRRPDLWLWLPIKTLFGKNRRNKGVLCTVLAATAGTGNIVGVAAALTAGGPGAVFWMWVSAVLGMALGFAENVLGFHYRKTDRKGNCYGSAAMYIEKGLKSKTLATLFCAACALAAFGIGNLTQGNAMVGGIGAAFKSIGIDFDSKTALIIGIITAVVAAPSILGSKDTVAKTASRLVPVAVAAFLIGSMTIIFINRSNILYAFKSIFFEAFNFKAVACGAGGYGIATAMRVGLSRGLFSHEAGMGSSVAVHATAQGNNPVEQGLWSMFEVFLDTVVVCTLTALVILTSGVYDKTLDGIQLISAAFSSKMGNAGNIFVAVMLTVFAFATILGWYCIGESAAGCILKKGTYFYKAVYLLAIPLGCVLKMQACWYLSDIFNWLMAIINIFAVTVLSNTVFKITKANVRKGKG